MNSLNVPIRRKEVKGLPFGLTVTKAIWYRDFKGNLVYFPNRKERRQKASGKNYEVQHIPVKEKDGKITWKVIFHLKALHQNHAKKHNYEK